MESFQFIESSGWSVKNFPDMDSEQTLILIFASPHFHKNQKPIKQLHQFYKKSKMIGCSSAGEIFGSHIFDQSLSVVVVRFERTELKIVKAQVHDIDDSFTAGQKISQELQHKDLRSIFVLAGGLKVNGTDLVNGLNSVSDTIPLITGGLAGDGSDFLHTWTIYNGEVESDQVVALGFYGNHLKVGHGSKGGWDIFGPSRRITRSTRNILYELDNQPALLLYKEYLGERAAELPASGLLYPLSIRDMSAKIAEPIVRTIVGIDEESQALIFTSDVPTGYGAQLMRANFDRLIVSANEAGEQARSNMFLSGEDSNNPMLAISISCVGRRLLLGERTEEETESTLDALPANTTQVGFYSYGELSPLVQGDCKLHNQTMTLTTYMEQ